MNCNPARRRCVLAIMAALLHGEGALSFFLTPSSSSALIRFQRFEKTHKINSDLGTSIRMADINTKSSRSVRLSRDEELELLRQTTEMRRIQELERELASRNPNKSPPLLSIRAKEAGYGLDWDGYEAALDNGHLARERLITCNMGLVHYCANDILKTQSRSKIGTLSKEDLVQEGVIGLSRAIEKFNIGIGGKLSSYAIYWIRAAMMRCIAERGEVVRVPEHVSTAVRKMSAAANKLGLHVNGETIVEQVFSTDPSTTKKWEEAQAAKALAEEAGLSDSQLRQAMRVQSRRRAGNVSFEDWVQRGRDLRSEATTNFDTGESEMDSRKLETELSKYLRPKEMQALSLRYGLKTETKQQEKQRKNLVNPSLQKESTPQRGKSGEAMSFNEVGKSMSVSTEYGRRLVAKAIEKLKKAAEEGQLEPALLY